MTEVMHPLTQLVNLQSPLSLYNFISESCFQSASKTSYEHQYLTPENVVEISVDLANQESKHD